MSQLVSPSPPLPKPYSATVHGLFGFDQDLNRALNLYLSALARRANGAVMADGSEPFSGALNLTGGQIIFPATQVPSSNANTLDDYEEGTWTLTISAGSGTITSYTVNETGYTKIGRMVHIHGMFTITNAGTGASYFNLSGFPFTSSASFEMGSVGREIAVTGTGYICHSRGGLTTGFMTTTDAAATPIATNYQVCFSAWYRST